MDADESPGYEDTMLELGAMVPGRSEYGVVGSKAQPDVDIDDYDLEAEYDVELMLQNHDDPAIDVLYVETRRRGIGPADGSVDETSMADGMLLLDDDADEMEPIAPRRESIDSPTEDWDIELGVDEEIKEAQQEMASGFRSLISLGVDKTSAAVSDSRLRYLDDVENETLGNILSDELTKIQSIMPELDVPVTVPNRCKLVSQLLFGGDLESSGVIDKVVAPVVSRGSSAPDLVTILDSEGKRLRMSVLDVDRLLRQVIMEKDNHRKKEAVEVPAARVNKSPLTQPATENLHSGDCSETNPRLHAHGRNTTPSRRNKSIESGGPHAVLLSTVKNTSEKLNTHWRNLNGGSRCTGVDSFIIQTVADLQLFLYTFCERSSNLQLSEDLRWPSAELVLMFKQLYSILEILAVMEGRCTGVSVGLTTPSSSTSRLCADREYRYALFADLNDSEVPSSPDIDRNGIQFACDRRPSQFLDLLVIVAYIFPWCIADLALIELRAAAHCLAGAYESFGQECNLDAKVQADERKKCVSSAVHLLTNYLQLVRYSMGTMISHRDEALLAVPSTADRLIHMENMRILDLNRRRLNTSSSDSRINLSVVDATDLSRRQHHRSNTWSSSSRYNKDKDETNVPFSVRGASGKSLDPIDTVDDNKRCPDLKSQHSRYCWVPSAAAGYFAIQALGDVGFILQGILPLNLIPSSGLKTALYIGNVSLKASAASGAYRRFGSPTYILDSLFYRLRSQREGNSTSDGSHEDTECLYDVAATSDGDSVEEDDDMSLELIVEPSDDVARIAAIKKNALSVGVPKLNLPVMPSTKSVMSTNSSGSTPIVRERKIQGPAATQKLFSLTPRSLSNMGQPLSARSSRSIDIRGLGTDGDASILTHQNLFSDARIYQSVKNVLLHSSSSDQDCIRYLLKNCYSCNDRADFVVPSKDKSKGGGGAEMIYILLNDIYRQLPRNYDSKYDEIDAGIIPTLLHILLQSMSETEIANQCDVSKALFRSLCRSSTQNIKCNVAAILAILAHRVDPEVTNMVIDKSDSYLLEAIYMMNYGWMVDPPGLPEPAAALSDFATSWLGTNLCAHPFSPLGAMITEQLGDAFLRDAKHKLAILSFESCLVIHLRLSTTLDKKIYRKLSLVAQEAGEIRRSLFYNCIILNLSQAEGNVNEFMYVSNRTSKLCVEIGEVSMAERFLRISNLLHLGLPLKSIKFEKLNLSNLPCHLLPHGLKIPAVFCGPKEIRQVGSTVELVLQNILFCDSIQIDILMQLCCVLVLSHRHSEVIGICQILLADRNLPFLSRYTILVKLASSLYGMGQFECAEAALNAICLAVDKVIFLAASKRQAIVQSAKAPSNGINPTAIFDDFVQADLRPKEATFLNENANEFHGQLMATINHASNGVSLAINKLKSQDYMLLRARVAKALKKYNTAIAWLDLLLLSAAASSDVSANKASLSGTVMPGLSVSPSTRGLVLYLMGRCYAMIAAEIDDTFFSSSSSESGVFETERRKFTESFINAEKSFLECIEIYKHIGDTVRESKACQKWAEIYVELLFDKVVSIPGCTVLNAGGGMESVPIGDKDSSRTILVNSVLREAIGEHITGLEHVELVSRHGLLLAGECGDPMLSIMSMISSAELALIQDRELFAINCWREAYVLLSVTYLEPLVSDSNDDSIYGSDEKSSTSRVNSAYTSLREPLELPCRFSYTVLIKLVNILRRLIRLAVFLSAATSALTSNNIVSSEFPFNSDLSTSFFADKLSGTEDFVRINAANSVSNLSPLSLHSQLIVTMQRLEFMTVSLQAPLCPFSSCNQSVDNPVLEGYIEKYMNAQPQLSHFAAAQFSPAFLMMHLRSRLFDTIFVNVSPDLKSCPALNKRVVACTVAAAVEELYPLELQRLALCSEAHAKPIAGRVNGIRWAKGNLKSQNKQTALSVIDSVMTQLIRTTVSEIEQVAFSQSPCPTSARFIFVATEGVLVSLKVPLHCRSDNISCKDSSMQKGLHFAAVAEAASSRYMETDKCVRNKLKIANYLATVNDIYAKPSKIGFEFNAGVSRSHQVAAPILPEAYNECDGLNEYPPDEHCVLRGRIDKMFCINDSSICNSDLLITCISSPDYTTAESDVDICISRPLTTRGPIDTASHNLTAPLDLLPISVAKSQAALPHEHEGHFAHPQTPRVKKSDVAVPVAITFKASQGSDSFAQSRSRSQFDMKILIPRTIRNAFSYSPRDLNTLGLVDDVKSAQINTGGRQLDLSQSRKADWDKLFRALVEKDSSYSESAVSTTQSIKIIVPTAISESQSQRIVRIFPKGRLDALYDSFRFEILFIRLHAQVRQLSNPDAIALYASPVYASGLAPGSDCSRQFDRFIGLSNACSTSVGLLEENVLLWAKQLRHAGKVKVHPLCSELRRKQMSILRVLVKQCNRYAALAARHELGKSSKLMAGATNANTLGTGTKDSGIRRNASDNSLSIAYDPDNSLSGANATKISHQKDYKKKSIANSPARSAGIYKGSVEINSTDLASWRRYEQIASPSIIDTPSLPQNAKPSKSEDKTKTFLSATLKPGASNKSEGRQRSISQCMKSSTQTQSDKGRRYAGIFSPLLCPAHFNTGGGDALLPLYPLGFYFCFFICPCLYVFSPDSAEKIMVDMRATNIHNFDVLAFLANRAGLSVQYRRRWVALLKIRAPKMKWPAASPRMSENIAEKRVDDCMSVLYQLLGSKKIVFLLNCVLLEQSILFLGPPGYEDLLAKCVLGLLDFCCGHVSRYAYIPLLCPSVAGEFILRKNNFANDHLPFIIGSYHSVLDRPVFRSSNCTQERHVWEQKIPENGSSASTQRQVKLDSKRVNAEGKIHFYCPWDQLNVTVVDTYNGTVWPGSKMQFAATISAPEWFEKSTCKSYDSRVDKVNDIFSQLQTINPNLKIASYLPPLPLTTRIILRDRSSTVSDSTDDSLNKISSSETDHMSLFTDIHSAMSALIFLVPLFCTVATIFEDGSICECSGNGQLDVRKKYNDVATVLIKTAVRTLFNVENKKNSPIDLKCTGRFKHCEQYTTAAVANIIEGCCHALNFQCSATLKYEKGTNTTNEMCATLCSYCSSAQGGQVSGRKRSLCVLLFDNDAFLEYSYEKRPFLMAFCKLRSFERLLLLGALGSKNAIRVLHACNFESRQFVAPNCAADFDLTKLSGPCFYPFDHLRTLATPNLAKYIKYKHKRIAGYLYVCVARVNISDMKPAAHTAPLTHIFPVEVVRKGNMDNSSTSNKFDIDLNESLCPSSDNYFGHMLGTVELSRFKKRWCIIDGFRLSYCKSKSDSIIKDSFVLNNELSELWTDKNERLRLLVPSQIGEDGSGISTVPPVFGLDRCVQQLSCIPNNASLKSRTIYLFYSPRAPFLSSPAINESISADASLPSLAPMNCSETNMKIGDLLYHTFDADTNNWMTAIASRLAPDLS